jgi:hypothetical protein
VKYIPTELPLDSNQLPQRLQEELYRISDAFDMFLYRASFTPVYKGSTAAGTNVGTYEGSYSRLGDLVWMSIYIDQTTNTGATGNSIIDISASGLSQATTDTPAVCTVVANNLGSVTGSVVGILDGSEIALYQSNNGSNSAIAVDTGTMTLTLNIIFRSQ